MGHKIILCVNERGILLASLCSGGRGLAVAGGAGPGAPAAALRSWSIPSPFGNPRAPQQAVWPMLGWAAVPGLGHGFDAGVGGMNLCLLLHPLLWPQQWSRGKGRCPAQMRWSQRALEVLVKA